VNIFFCEEKQKVGLFVYHLEGLRVPLVVRVPQFENHWINRLAMIQMYGCIRFPKSKNYYGSFSHYGIANTRKLGFMVMAVR